MIPSASLPSSLRVSLVPSVYYPYGCVLVLTLFCVSVSINALLRVSFSPISSLVQQQFGIDSDDVNWLSCTSIFAYIIFFGPSTWIIEMTNLRVATVCGCVLGALGALRLGWRGEVY